MGGVSCPSRPPADGSRYAEHAFLLVQPIELDGARIGTISLRSHLRELEGRSLRHAGIEVPREHQFEDIGMSFMNYLVDEH